MSLHRNYDAAGRRIAKTPPLGETTTYSYDANGNLLSRINPFGAETTSAYDPENRLIAMTDPLSNTAKYSYDAAGDLAAMSYAGGSTVNDGELYLRCAEAIHRRHQPARVE